MKAIKVLSSLALAVITFILVLSHLMWKPPGIQLPTVLMDLQPEILNVLITISHPFEPFDFIVEPL